MGTVRSLFGQRHLYEPVDNDSSERNEINSSFDRASIIQWQEYVVFLLLGVEMLWAWSVPAVLIVTSIETSLNPNPRNMFLAAGPYFQTRFSSSKSILANFQAAELFVSTVINLAVMLLLIKLQKNASYPRRIVIALLINIAAFTLLAISSKVYHDVTAVEYFTFLMIVVGFAALATGLLQNGAFAYAAGYGHAEYIQAIMAGQGIAGVLPPIAQIIAVMSAAGDDATNESSTSALMYFLAATGVSVFAFIAFSILLQYHSTTEAKSPSRNLQNSSDAESEDIDVQGRDAGMDQSVALTKLTRKLFYPALSIFLTFAVTILFPVFTQAILSVQPHPPPLLQKASFIPLAFLVWNFGDLLGRLLPLSPSLSMVKRPKILLLLSIGRVIFIPLYLICNIQRPETSTSLPITQAVIKSDVFYFLVVQFPFGLSNGYLGSCCMMAAPAAVDQDEREAAGGFMGLILVLGLAVGSFCSFFVGNLV